jgi:hypothetical protein
MSVAMFNAYELGNLAKAIEDASPGRNERILQTLATFSRLNTECFNHSYAHMGMNEQPFTAEEIRASMPARAILPHAASVAFRMDSNLTATDGTEFAGPPSFALEFMDVLSSFIGRIAHYADLLE